jgi:membrane protein implicated in regulation of membrane protease activity
MSRTDISRRLSLGHGPTPCCFAGACDTNYGVTTCPLAALAAAVIAALGAGAGIALLVFIVGSVASLALLRPIARRHVRVPAISRTGTDALVGSKAVVLRRVDADGGRVRIGGEEWSARAYLEDQILDEGARVDVVKIEGATALVVE